MLGKQLILPNMLVRNRPRRSDSVFQCRHRSPTVCKYQLHADAACAPCCTLQAAVGDMLYEYHRQYTARRVQRAEETNAAMVRRVPLRGPVRWSAR
jgi:hypothetical protein